MRHGAIILLGTIAACLSTWDLRAISTTESASYAVGTAIPDNDLSGLADTRSFSSAIATITSVKVGLNISGGYNGDLYAYVTHGSGFTVLLNRTGVTASDPFGYADTGFNVILSDSAANGDIHSYQATLGSAPGTLTGAWQPDARNVSPLTVVDTDSRTAFLNSFTGLDPGGDWTLFVADVSPGGTATLESWSLEITGISSSSPPPTVVLDQGETGWLAVIGIGLTLLASSSMRRRHFASRQFAPIRGSALRQRV